MERRRVSSNRFVLRIPLMLCLVLVAVLTSARASNVDDVL